MTLTLRLKTTKQPLLLNFLATFDLKAPGIARGFFIEHTKYLGV